MAWGFMTKGCIEYDPYEDCDEDAEYEEPNMWEKEYEHDPD